MNFLPTKPLIKSSTNAQQKVLCNWGMTLKQSSEVHIQAVVSGDVILPGINCKLRLLVINLASFPADSWSIPQLHKAINVVRHFKQTLRLTNYILTIALLATLSSCDRLKRKGHETVDKTQEKIGEAKQNLRDKKDQLVEKVFRTYDNTKPDTEANKKRFKQHLQIDLPRDVKNIYAYGDFLGADYKVLISFICDKPTIESIIKKKNMVSTNETDGGLLFGEDFFWWNKNKIDNIVPYRYGKEYEYWEYLWYDEQTKTAYYEEFSL